MRKRRWIWPLVILLGLYGIALAVFRLHVDEILRRTIERNMNTRLDGYTVRIGKVHFHPLGFSLDLLDTTVYQNAHPNPPIARVPLLSAGVHWRALLHRRLVADFLLDRPILRVDLTQAKTEIRSKTPISQRGWQDALEEIYPLKVNVFEVYHADITYVDRGPFKPLHLSELNFVADNIRNVHSAEHVYPSTVHVDGIIFDTGALNMDGHANFLAKPSPGIQGAFKLRHVELGYFEPIIRRYNVSVRNGVFSTDGSFEYAPGTRKAEIQQVTVQGVDLEYIHQARTAAEEHQVAQTVARSAKQAANEPGVELRLDKVSVLNSTFGYEDKAGEPPYRVFLSDAEIHLDNLSNQGAEGTATGTVKGKFMGSGPTKVQVRFRPKAKSADLQAAVSIDDTNMPALNDLLRRYAGFDVAEGLFSFYSEVRLRDGQVDGYVKPLFRDLQVYGEEKDREKPFLQRLKQRLIGAAAWILRNRERKEVATEVHISGRLDSPQFSSWEAVGALLRNAFIQAILPGLETQTKAQPHGKTG